MITVQHYITMVPTVHDDGAAQYNDGAAPHDDGAALHNEVAA